MLAVAMYLAVFIGALTLPRIGRSRCPAPLPILTKRGIADMAIAMMYQLEPIQRNAPKARKGDNVRLSSPYIGWPHDRHDGRVLGSRPTNDGIRYRVLCEPCREVVAVKASFFLVRSQ